MAACLPETRHPEETMIEPSLLKLAVKSRTAVPVLDQSTDLALAKLDRITADLAAALQVEYYGPPVGLDAGRDVYRLVVREHRLSPSQVAWGLWVCTALPHAQWRADWRIQDTSRLRKRQIVAALPAFFSGFLAAVEAAGRGQSRAGRRLAEFAELFQGAAVSG